MPLTDSRFGGVAGRTVEESVPWWPSPQLPPAGAPNVVLVLLDDVGYAQFGCYGSDIATPTFDRLAGQGLRYANFHTTALCSPTRSCLLTGRNHHSNGMARIATNVGGYPGYTSTIPRANGFLSEVLLREGYATYAVGKWHLSAQQDITPAGPFDTWPLGRGFERFYGFLRGETDQYYPDLVEGNQNVDRPKTPEQGYHLTEDITDRAIQYLSELRSAAPGKPFFLYYAPGACHAPHQAPQRYIDAYRGRFDAGWEAWRDQVFARQVASGLLPPDTDLPERPDWVPDWGTLTADEKRVFARMMEVFAGFLTHTDEQVGRLVAHLESLGELDNTIFIVTSDNGASQEGGPQGTHNEGYYFNGVPTPFSETLAKIDDLGTPRAFNHYPWGWAWAGNCPFRRFKQNTHEGGVADPLIISWPARLGSPGQTRGQYCHAIDVTPTLLEAIGVEAPAEINGVPQSPIEGVSFAHTLTDGGAPSHHLTQYYEMLGSRGIYHDGWKAVAYRPPAGSRVVHQLIDPPVPLDAEPWELYHVAADFSECHDLAEKEPDKLAQMKERWWAEAARYQVLPAGQLFGPSRPGTRRSRYELSPGVYLPAFSAPPLRPGRPHEITAALIVPSGGQVEGAIIAHGSQAGGYAVYVKNRRVHYAYNRLGAQVQTVAATTDLPTGPVTVRISYTPAGPNQGEIRLFQDDSPVGQGSIRTAPRNFAGAPGIALGFQRGGPVTDDLPGRADLTPGVLLSVNYVVGDDDGQPELRR